MLFDVIATTLTATHFGIPLLYYWYLKSKWYTKPWNIKTDPNYRPKVTIIVPTYREVKNIEKKLDNLRQQDYPRDKIEIIVIDSASDDGTPEVVKKWAERNPDIKLVLLEEPVRLGMVQALNRALNHVSRDSEVVIFTDADAFWERDTLRQSVKYFADKSVGAVTTCIAPLEDRDEYLETTYRSYYNVVRVGESKIHSTPIHNGALIAYRKELLDRIGGLPTYTGNNDSTPASLIAFAGYRAIQINDTIVREPVAERQIMRKIRRAQHLILHFIHTKRYAKKLGIYRRSVFDKIWLIESYLHLVNPWLLAVATILLILSAISSSLLAITMLSTALPLLIVKPFRTWITNQLFLIIAMIRNIWNRELVWSK